MKVFILQVGDPLPLQHQFEESRILKRIYFNTGKIRDFEKSYIINADTQMHSLIKNGIDVSYGYLGKRKSLVELWKAGIKLRQVIKKEKIELVHVMWGSTTALMAVLMSQVPVIISFSGSDLIGVVDAKGQITKGGRLSRFLSQIAASLAGHLITKSLAMKEGLWSRNKNKCSVIPNGVDLTSFSTINPLEAKRKAGWENESGKIVLFMNGANAPVKNLPLAEKTFQLVKGQMKDVTFKVITHAHFDSMKYLYNAADVMLICSFHEGSNNSIKEAMACNLPVVSVNCGDAKERLDKVKHCKVVDQYDAGVLAKEIITILSGNERSNGSNFTNEFSLVTIAAKVTEVYHKLLNTKNK